MKKIYYFYLYFVVLFFSCNPESNFFTVDRLPTLIHQESLPPFPHELKREIFKLETRLLISENGDVLAVELISSSASRTWDSLAIQKLKKWVFTPAILHNTPIKVWIKQPIRIAIKEPLYLYLAEIVFDNATIAYRIYDSLETGKDFFDLVDKYSTSPSKTKAGKIGNINIRELDPALQKDLETLGVNEYTKPIIYQGRYTIFKRITNEN